MRSFTTLFSSAPYTNSSEMSLELTNPSADHYVAFKVKTIDPKR